VECRLIHVPCVLIAGSSGSGGAGGGADNGDGAGGGGGAGAVKIIAKDFNMGASAAILAKGGNGGSELNGCDGGVGGTSLSLLLTVVWSHVLHASLLSPCYIYIQYDCVCACVYVCACLSVCLPVCLSLCVSVYILFVSTCTHSGGGSGGTIWIESRNDMVMKGTLSVAGGAGGVPQVGGSCGVSATGGAGSPGRVWLKSPVRE
jgi:hypothetical protein